MKKERNKEIISLYKKGWTMRALGEKYGVTRTAIWFVIRSYRETRGIEHASQLRQWRTELDRS